jgi:hypothetical protein
MPPENIGNMLETNRLNGFKTMYTTTREANAARGHKEEQVQEWRHWPIASRSKS